MELEVFEQLKEISRIQQKLGIELDDSDKDKFNVSIQKLKRDLWV